MNSSDPTTFPVGMPPPGQTVNFTEGPSQAWMPRLAIYTTLPVTVGFLALRVYARFKTKIPFGLDDYLCIASVFASSGFCGLLLSNVINDMYGRHSWNIPRSAITGRMMQENCATSAFYCWAAALIKLSFCFFFHRIFSPSLYSKVMIWTGIILVAVSYLAFFIAWVVCTVPLPGEQGWGDPVFAERIAPATVKISLGLGALGVFTDFFIIAIPLTAIPGLRISTQKKIGISALFATGLLSCSFSAAGLVARWNIYRERLVDKTGETLWIVMPSYGLTVAELNIGIICSCVPVIFPLFKGLAETASTRWDSWKHYRFSFRTPSTTLQGSTEIKSDASATRWGLPRVPGGNLRTLLSFTRSPHDARDVGKSQGTITVTQDTDIEMSPPYGLESMELSSMYHSHLFQKSSQQTLVTSHANLKRT